MGGEGVSTQQRLDRGRGAELLQNEVQWVRGLGSNGVLVVDEQLSGEGVGEEGR